MANLSDAVRVQIWRGLMRYFSRLREPLALNKVELRAAIDATDEWIDSNRSAYNSELPAAAQSGLSATQKTLLFCVVALARTSVPLLRKILGEVD